MKKIFNWHYLQIINQKYCSPDLQSVLNNPDDAMSYGKIIKDGGTNSLSIVALANGTSVIIKRSQTYKSCAWLRWLKKSRGRNSWQSAHLLTKIGVPTPVPLALIEKRKGPFVQCSYFIAQYLESVNLKDYLLQKNINNIVEQVKNILHMLQKSLIVHGDLKYTNFIVSDGLVYLIDLDSMIRCKNCRQYAKRRQKDHLRFHKNWQDISQIANLFIDF